MGQQLARSFPELLGPKSDRHMSYSLNSLKGGSIGDYVGQCRGIL